MYQYCRRCGKELKDLESRIRGYGAECYNKHMKVKRSRYSASNAPTHTGTHINPNMLFDPDEEKRKGDTKCL